MSRDDIRPGWLSRHAVGCFYVALYLALLTGAEHVLITRFILPVPASTRLDWYIATCAVAPLAAGAVVWVIMLAGWLVCLVTPRKRQTRKRYERQH